MSDDEYEVGYGKPPKHSRFKPGQSGNPKGRPPKPRKPDEILDAILNKKVPIVEGGKRRRVRREEVMYMRMVNDAAQGDRHARAEVLKHIQSRVIPDDLEIDSADIAALDAYVNKIVPEEGTNCG